MSRTYISAALRRLVMERANGRCEYCLISEVSVFTNHQPDHIIAEQHGGETNAENLALACVQCNKQKGPNIASIDRETGVVSLLFNPRTQVWAEHFELDGFVIRPLTAEGRVTVRVLGLNGEKRLAMRQALLENGEYP